MDPRLGEGFAHRGSARGAAGLDDPSGELPGDPTWIRISATHQKDSSLGYDDRDGHGQLDRDLSLMGVPVPWAKLPGESELDMLGCSVVRSVKSALQLRSQYGVLLLVPSGDCSPCHPKELCELVLRHSQRDLQRARMSARPLVYYIHERWPLRRPRARPECIAVYRFVLYAKYIGIAHRVR